jgi:Arabinose efflux permease
MTGTKPEGYTQADAGTVVLPASGQQESPVARNRYYILAILMLIYACNVLDRTVIVVILEPIKAEFDVSDGQLGLLTGLAFAGSFALAGIPIGVAADRFNRRNLLAACLIAWSAATAFCGAARNFAQLMLARVGVGIGEAGLTPAALSMIADLFPARERATATSILYLAVPLGSFLAFMGGAWVTANYGWRYTFYAAAVPGLLLTVLFLLTVREPQRTSSKVGGPDVKSLPVSATLRFIVSQRSLMHIMMGTILGTLTNSGVGVFKTSFFLRVYEVPLSTVAPILGVINAVFAVVGILSSGILSDRMARLDERWRSWVVAICVAAYVPLIVAMAFSPTMTISLCFAAGAALIANAWNAPAYALTYGLVAPRMRATTIALIMVLTNLIGFGLGPPLAGMLSDFFQDQFGKDALRYSLSILVCCNIWAALHFFLSSLNLKREMARAATL